MDSSSVLLLLVVVVALGFDFTNGFHDTANAMATSIATGALRPKVAVLLSGVLNLVGAFLSVQVALTVTNAVVSIQTSSGAPDPSLTANDGSALLMIVLAGLVGAITWNVLTWLLGLPSSSSHALFGGLIGATVAGLGWSGVNWKGDGSKLDGVVGKVILPAVMSPLLAAFVAAIGTWLVFRIIGNLVGRSTDQGFRWGQIGSASMVSLAHGTNDAQKTMGVITLALIASGHWTDTSAVPLWVKLCCALAISLGTFLGGWRIIRTVGKGLVEITSPSGMAAESSSAALILVSSQLGLPLSTTQVCTGSILGTGIGKPDGVVRWRVAGRMVVAWCITMPAAGLTGAAMWWIGSLFNDLAGAFAMVVILVALSGWMWLRSRLSPIGANNVNDDWEEPAERRATVSAGRD